MSKLNVNDHGYTAAEDLRDVLQLLALIGERPAVKKGGERCTLISYREMYAMNKRLTDALRKVEGSAIGVSVLTATAIHYVESVDDSDVTACGLPVNGDGGVAAASENREKVTCPDCLRVLNSSGIGADDDRNRSL